MQRTALIFGIACLLSFYADAADIYVNPTPLPGQYPTLQEGLDAASDGDTVLIYDGTYSGAGNVNLDFNGKEITLVSINGSSAVTIDCGNVDGTRAFRFHNEETSSSVIDGLTIRNGQITSGNGGGILIESEAIPTILNCRIIDCQSEGDGGGIYSAGGGTFDSVEFFDNIASNNGGGLYVVSGKVINCRFTGNTAVGDSSTTGKGGGVYAFASQLERCWISNNASSTLNGGGVFSSASDLTNCVVILNGASAYGAGVYAENSTLTNCTITNNTSSSNSGGGVYNNNSLIQNSIVYFNTAPTSANIALHSAESIVRYSCVQGGTTANSNITSNPSFVNLSASDLHLNLGSPCRNKAMTAVAPGVDIEGNPRFAPTGSTTVRPALGAYENHGANLYTISGNAGNQAGVRIWIGNYSVVSSSGGVYAINNVPAGVYTLTGALAGYAVNPNGFTSVTITNANVTNRNFSLTLITDDVIVSPSGSDLTGKGTLAEPFATVQMGIYAAPDNGTVVLQSGVYNGSWNRDITFTDRAVTLMSEVPDGVVIDCESIGRGLCVDLSETALVIDGLKVINGLVNGMGGGLWIWDCASPLVRNCSFDNCSAAIGGGVADRGDSKLRNLIITNCSSRNEGGGAYLYDSMLIGSTIFGCSAGTVGGGVSAVNGSIVRNCIVWNNTALANPQIRNLSSTIEYSCVEGGSTGTGNISTDPLFVNSDPDVAAGESLDLHILNKGSFVSPCIDAGTTTGASSTDHDRNPRDATPDIGAYEWQDFFITGTITGPGAVGATIIAVQNAVTEDTDLSDAFGDYSLAVPANETFTVSASMSGVFFNPVEYIVDVGYQSWDEIDFASATGFDVSGTIIGVRIDEVSLSLTGTCTALGGASVSFPVRTADATGHYTFVLADGQYTLTATLAGYKVSPSIITFTVNGGDMRLTQIKCSKPKKDDGGCSVVETKTRTATSLAAVCLLLAGAFLLKRKS